MPTLINLKRFAAILLMICFVLPLSHCDRDDKPAATAGAKTEAARQQAPADQMHGDKFAYQNVEADEPVRSALTIAAFFWPLIFFAFGGQALSFRAGITVNLLEVLLCAGSAYMIFGITLFGDLRYGGYLAYSSVAAYSIAALGQIVWRLKSRFRRS